MLPQKELLNFPLSLGSYQQFNDEIINLARSGKSSFVCVAAVHQVIEAYKDPSFAHISHKADLVTPDGMALTWALRILYNIRQDRVAGMDLLPSLLPLAEREGISVYFYGGTDEMLNRTRTYLSNKYPNLKISGVYSPPFRALTANEEADIAEMINNSGAQLVFVVLGCPKQERWMNVMRGRINATMVGIGAALPVLVGIQSRAPLWMQRAGIEWLYRLGQEPKRLWKRYFVTNSMFIYLVTTEKLKGLFRRTKTSF